MKFMKTATINSLLFIGVYTTMVLVCIGVNTMIDVKFLGEFTPFVAGFVLALLFAWWDTKELRKK